MKMLRFLYLSLCAVAISVSCTRQQVNLLTDGSFDSSETTAWHLGNNSAIADGVCRMTLFIEPYNTQWCEMCTQRVSVEPDTDYRLCFEARTSLYPVSNGLYVGARKSDGKLLKDRLFLLGRDNMTPLTYCFNSGDQTEIVVFAGAWCDQDAVFELDNIYLNAI